MKIMYPARLHPDTKCPNCQTKIVSIGGSLFSCQNGHIVECVVMVTLNKSQQAGARLANDVKPTQEATKAKPPGLTQ